MHADMVPTYMRSARIAPPHITTHSRECRKTYPTERLQKPVQPSRTAELARPTSNATKTSSSQELTATEYAKRGYSELPRRIPRGHTALPNSTRLTPHDQSHLPPRCQCHRLYASVIALNKKGKEWTRPLTTAREPTQRCQAQLRRLEKGQEVLEL